MLKFWAEINPELKRVNLNPKLTSLRWVGLMGHHAMSKVVLLDQRASMDPTLFINWVKL